MRSRPMIASSVVVGLADAIRAGGGDPDDILAELDLYGAGSRAEAFIPCSSFARLLERAAALTGDQAFGLHYGGRLNPKTLGPLAYAVINAPTISAALNTAGRYIHLHNESADVSLTEESNLSHLNYIPRDLEVDEPRQFIEYGMAVALNTLRVMAGSQWSPREVHFTHRAPKETSAHLAHFQAPVLFGCATNAFVMDREFCSQPVPAADPNLFRILSHYLDDVLSRMPKEDKDLRLCRKTIAQLMNESAPTLARAAKALSVSPRTLQRQLKSQRIDFKELVEDTRRRFAMDYLKNRDNTLTQIAFLLGYSEVSAFNRAFKRWTGKTPSDYRREAYR